MARKYSKTLKLGIGVVIIIAAFGFSYTAILDFLNPYKFVSNITTNPDRYINKQVQVVGVVVPGSVVWVPRTLKFEITDGDSKIGVIYNGDPPAAFKEGLRVVTIGTLLSPNQFQAAKILTQCPSKYEQALIGALNKTKVKS